MGLINLLSVGRSLIGVSHGTGHYKLAQGNLLPNFGGARPLGGAAGKAVIRPKSAAPARGTAQSELKLEVPSPVKQAVPEPPKVAPVAVAAVAPSLVKAAAAETKPDLATATATATARPRAEEKFTLGRWVSLMLNR